MQKKTLGIIGGGQLGRMLVEAAKKLNIKTIVLDPTPDSPAGQLADKQIVGDFKDPGQIERLAKEVDYITFEIESTEASILKQLYDGGAQVHPSPHILATIQDKLIQKEWLTRGRIAVAPFLPVTSPIDVQTAMHAWRTPVVLKARRHGYDGRGNALIRTFRDITRAWKKLGNQPVYVEQFIPFKKEIAIQIARSTTGKIVLFPLVETIHKNNICHIVKMPANVSPLVGAKARNLARKIAKRVDGAGVFGVEMFVTKKNEVLINELAPRVHNSGHHTIEACTVSQFETHVRVVCGLEVQNPRLLFPAAAMINILGARDGEATPKHIEKALQIEGVSVHMYGKKQVRKERKMGHITAVAPTLRLALKRAEQAKKLIRI